MTVHFITGEVVSFGDLLTQIEEAVDAHSKLTRTIKGIPETAEVSVSRHGWSAVIRVKLKGSRKRPCEISGFGETTPAEAVRKLIDSLDHWAEAIA